MDPRYTVSLKDKCSCDRVRPSSLKVVSASHIIQDSFLPVFFPKPHSSQGEQQLPSLDVRRASAIYIERTKPFRNAPKSSSCWHAGRGACLSHPRGFRLRWCRASAPPVFWPMFHRATLLHIPPGLRLLCCLPGSRTLSGDVSCNYLLLSPHLCLIGPRIQR